MSLQYTGPACHAHTPRVSATHNAQRTHARTRAFAFAHSTTHARPRRACQFSLSPV
jgi:hypothetical protein